MRRIFICLLLALPTGAVAQSGRIKIDLPASLAAKATESVDVSIDGPMLRLAARFLSDDDSQERNVREMVRKLDGIYVHSYEFDEADAYDRSIIDKIHAQLGPEWKRIVTVKSRTKENVEIYTQPRGESIAGLLVLCAEPRELTIVNIVGPIDLDKLAGLEGQFGIPRISREEKKHD